MEQTRATKADQENNQRAESVRVEESIPKRNRATAKYLSNQRGGKAEQNGEGREIDHLHHGPSSKEEGQRAGDQRNDKESRAKS